MRTWHFTEEEPGVARARISLGEGAANVERRPILFSKDMESAYKYFVRQDGPINTDSGDNRFFEFQVPEGNTIEVCTEPR